MPPPPPLSFRCLGHLNPLSPMLSFAPAESRQIAVHGIHYFPSTPLSVQCCCLLSSFHGRPCVERSLFVASGQLLRHIDLQAKGFVLRAKGIEQRHNVLHVLDPVSIRGLGLQRVRRNFCSHGTEN